jgi:hypothetical protein
LPAEDSSTPGALLAGELNAALLALQIEQDRLGCVAPARLALGLFIYHGDS